MTSPEIKDGGAAMRAAFLSAALLLSGCSIDEDRARIEKALPNGCTLHDMGTYGEIDRLVFIACPDRDITTTGYESYMCGKVPCSHSYAVFSARARQP